ncbi:hypothetical protein [Geminocystis sp. NIES-3709]|uniref:hypothetical protein n=1 Tax=Geminocystis sp. NIES-3709 TaxID=1617448 RepID=UPI0005FC53A9|nr:hypothetical protein [Geminocystis sp. NIES-3709]BAQ64091.1 hypothetical protein GM3709_856 [Geminocystis sp. NIES-3709]
MSLTTKFLFHAGTIVSLLLLKSPMTIGQVPPYGAQVNEYNSRAWSASQQGDYDTAIINYQRAGEAAKKLTNPILRDCAVSGAMANRQAAQIAKQYLKQEGIVNSTTLQQAREREINAFEAYYDQFYLSRPDLVNRCP